VAQIGGEIMQRRQYECPLMKARVWNLQTWDLKDQVVIKQNIQVDQARAVTNRWSPAQMRLQIFEEFEQFIR